MGGPGSPDENASNKNWSLILKIGLQFINYKKPPGLVERPGFFTFWSRFGMEIRSRLFHAGSGSLAKKADTHNQQG